MREETCKVTCDKCGANIEDRGEWGLLLDLWTKSDDIYSWRADLCDKCKEVVLNAILALGVTLRYLKE